MLKIIAPQAPTGPLDRGASQETPRGSAPLQIDGPHCSSAGRAAGDPETTISLSGIADADRLKDTDATPPVARTVSVAATYPRTPAYTRYVPLGTSVNRDAPCASVSGTIELEKTDRRADEGCAAAPDGSLNDLCPRRGAAEQRCHESGGRHA